MSESRTIKFIANRKLSRRDDNFWEDDYGSVFDLRPDGRLFEQRQPSMWYLIHRPETVVDARARRFESVEGV